MHFRVESAEVYPGKNTNFRVATKKRLFRNCNGCSFLTRKWAVRNLRRVDGLRIIADRWIWCGLRKSDQNPSKNRSSTDRLGARFRERLMTRSCCFISRLSATMVLAPPVPKSLARVVKRCMSKKYQVLHGRIG